MRGAKKIPTKIPVAPNYVTMTHPGLVRPYGKSLWLDPTEPRTRDYLLKVDGWAKDADANTAFSENVLPLPFHAMSSYPYKANEHFPQDTEHAAYVHDYLTRPALHLIRPLAPARTSE